MTYVKVGNGKRGGIHEHRLVAERALGRPLPKGSVVHHIDGNPANNDPSNLVILNSKAEHNALHRREAAFDACGNPDWVRCGYCKEYVALGRDDVHYFGNTPSAVHKDCNVMRRRKIVKNIPIPSGML